MKSNVGFDIDGVLADWVRSYTEYMHLDSGLDVLHTTDDIKSFSMSPWYQTAEEFEQGYHKWLHNKQNPYLGLYSISSEDMNYLARMNNVPNNFNVSFISARNETSGAPVKTQTQAWLQLHGVWDPEVYIRSDKGKVCNALGIDFFLDDNPDNLEDIVKESPDTVPVLMKRLYNTEAHRKFPMVGTVEEYFNLVRNRV